MSARLSIVVHHGLRARRGSALWVLAQVDAAHEDHVEALAPRRVHVLRNWQAVEHGPLAQRSTCTAVSPSSISTYSETIAKKVSNVSDLPSQLTLLGTYFEALIVRFLTATMLSSMILRSASDAPDGGAGEGRDSGVPGPSPPGEMAP